MSTVSVSTQASKEAGLTDTQWVELGGGDDVGGITGCVLTCDVWV